MPSQIPIAIFVDRYAPGGTQRQMIELLARLDRTRFRVHPVCFHSDGAWFDRVAALGEPVALFPIHGFRRPDTARQLRAFSQWCRTNRIAVLHTCELYSNIFGLPGAALASVPVRIGSRRGFVEPLGAQCLQRLAYSAAHRVVANSKAAAHRLQVERVPNHKVVVIPNGIDLSLFPPREYSPRPRRIAMVACLREEKRIDVLIAAAPRVLARHPDAQFVIAGDGSCRDELVALARTTGVFESFRFLGHSEDVPAVLAGSDLFVLPSRSEAFPNSIIEAMAAGLPVVATNVGGIPELVADGRTGRLVPPDNAEALAAALIDVLAQPDRAAELGRAGRRDIEQTYSFDRMVDQFETLYLTELDHARLRKSADRNRVKRVVKGALMNTYLASRFPPARDRIYARFGRGRLTVLNYHQVRDPADDGSTVATAAFREQMQFVKQHYHVLPLAEAVRVVSARGNTQRVVAITFDDGYLDNVTIAAPILRGLGLPACFFVSTDMIGSTRPFPHDVAQGRPPQDHMSWDDLRALAAEGFEIGSHTCSHADLGAVSLEHAEHELRASRRRLEEELGKPIGLFAFPYGHRRNMRRDTMAAARREYDVCCSAYGGHNTSPVNPGNVRRVVISTGVTFLAFRAVLEGWPMVRLANPYRAPAHAAQALITNPESPNR
jgi:glycosyltransferase involved in cell wall biosynthesis/peptidoglycan/xylan/chitin deacetylase (PgdA/CDA1 family)